MIVFRMTNKIKRGHMVEAVALYREMAALLPELTVRIYNSELGPGNTIVWESEHESGVSYAQWNAEFRASKGFSLWREKMDEIGGEGSAFETWNLR